MTLRRPCDESQRSRTLWDYAAEAALAVTVAPFVGPWSSLSGRGDEVLASLSSLVVRHEVVREHAYRAIAAFSHAKETHPSIR